MAMLQGLHLVMFACSVCMQASCFCGNASCIAYSAFPALCRRQAVPLLNRPCAPSSFDCKQKLHVVLLHAGHVCSADAPPCVFSDMVHSGTTMVVSASLIAVMRHEPYVRVLVSVM
jgi:hypothetical protein